MAEEQQQQRKSRTLRVIIAVIVLLIIAIAVLLWLLSRQTTTEAGPAPTNAAPIEAPSGGLQPTGTVGTPVSPSTAAPSTTSPAPASDGRAALRSLAMAFTERYGSYSNQSDFVNLLDLEALMSQAMAARTDDFVERARASMDQGSAYAGTVSRALTAKVDQYDQSGGQASVTVSAQRRQASGVAADRVYYQDLKLNFIRSGDSWLVDSATWQEERDSPQS